MLELETLFMLVKAVLFEYDPSSCLHKFGPPKWTKPHLKVFLENLKILGQKWRILNTYNFKISWLGTWFMFELIRVGAVPDLDEPQALKNISLHIMIDQAFTFLSYLKKRFTHSSFDVL